MLALLIVAFFVAIMAFVVVFDKPVPKPNKKPLYVLLDVSGSRCYKSVIEADMSLLDQMSQTDEIIVVPYDHQSYDQIAYKTGQHNLVKWTGGGPGGLESALLNIRNNLGSFENPRIFIMTDLY